MSVPNIQVMLFRRLYNLSLFSQSIHNCNNLEFTAILRCCFRTKHTMSLLPFRMRCLLDVCAKCGDIRYSDFFFRLEFFLPNSKLVMDQSWLVAHLNFSSNFQCLRISSFPPFLLSPFWCACVTIYFLVCNLTRLFVLFQSQAYMHSNCHRRCATVLLHIFHISYHARLSIAQFKWK